MPDNSSWNLRSSEVLWDGGGRRPGSFHQASNPAEEVKSCSIVRVWFGVVFSFLAMIRQAG